VIPEAAELFRATWHDAPQHVVSAPGRANLIGEHTDYNGGPVLPFAIDQRTWVAAGPGAGDAWEAISSLDGVRRRLTPGGRLPPGWTAYLGGVVHALREHGVTLPRSARVAVTSSVPAGAGLSSSAALTVALVRALSALAGVRVSRSTIAELAYRAEHDHVGVRCGRMDQTIAAFGREGHALLIEAATGARRHLPFARPVLLVDTGRPHRLSAGALNERRAECEAALARIRRWRAGTRALAELSADDLGEVETRLPRVLARRVRHVVTETSRTRLAAAALAQNRFRRLGELLVAGHASLRDDFTSSCAEADAVVEWAVANGAWGARLTGAGWGGTVVVVAPDRMQAAVRDSVTRRFARRFGRTPRTWIVRASAGVRMERFRRGAVY
jgi:galactokinase